MTDPALTGHARELSPGAGCDAPSVRRHRPVVRRAQPRPPRRRAMDGLVYSITPQVHTFDEESIAQSLEAQPDTVTTGLSFAAGLPLVVSPVTLEAARCGRRRPLPAQQLTGRDAPVLSRSSPGVAVRRRVDGGKHRRAGGRRCGQPDLLRDGRMARDHSRRPSVARLVRQPAAGRSLCDVPRVRRRAGDGGGDDGSSAHGPTQPPN